MKNYIVFYEVSEDHTEKVEAVDKEEAFRIAEKIGLQRGFKIKAMAETV